MWVEFVLTEEYWVMSSKPDNINKLEIYQNIYLLGITILLLLLSHPRSSGTKTEQKCKNHIIIFYEIRSIPLWRGKSYNIITCTPGYVHKWRETPHLDCFQRLESNFRLYDIILSCRHCELNNHVSYFPPSSSSLRHHRLRNCLPQGRRTPPSGSTRDGQCLHSKCRVLLRRGAGQSQRC